VLGDPPDRDRARERWFLALLFGAGFCLRWLFADGDFIGDDAWYLYLARGFGREAAVQHEQPWFHLLNRPLFYAFYHFSSYFGLVGFRLAGCVVGASIPLLSYVTARRFGVAPLWAALTAGALAVQRQQLEYSAWVFPDVLAAACALCACAAAARAQPRAVLGWGLCSVLAKESFVLVPAIAVALTVLTRRAADERERVRLDLWQWLTLVIPMAYVGAITAIGMSVPQVQMQGWSTTPFGLVHARNMWLAPEIWPWLVWLMWRRKLRILLLWLGLPVFYLLWSRVLGRGMAPWYAVGPSALASVAAAWTLQEWVASVRARVLSRGWQCGLLALLLASYASVPLYGLLRARAQLMKLQGFPWPRSAPEVRALIAQRQPSNVLLVDCFWAYRYSHLRGAQPATAIWWFGPQDDESVSERVRQSAFVVICRQPEHEAIVARLKQEKLQSAFEDRDWLVLVKAGD
jgi:hypothetical protein